MPCYLILLRTVLNFEILLFNPCSETTKSLSFKLRPYNYNKLRGIKIQTVPQNGPTSVLSYMVTNHNKRRTFDHFLSVFTRHFNCFHTESRKSFCFQSSDLPWVLSIYNSSWEILSSLLNNTTVHLLALKQLKQVHIGSCTRMKKRPENNRWKIITIIQGNTLNNLSYIFTFSYQPFQIWIFFSQFVHLSVKEQ